MRNEVIAKGRSLGGASDLTLLAPLKSGFVDAMESVTFSTRTKRVLEALHVGRQASHEHAAARLLSDAVERVGVIQSVRVAVLEEEGKVLLAVSFDGPWEAYIRVLWEKVGTLLDLVFWDTKDYVLSTNSFAEWLGWAKKVQVETGFFYGPPDFTAHDVQVQRRLHWLRHDKPDLSPEEQRLAEVRTVTPSAEDATAWLLNPRPTQSPGDPPIRPASSRFKLVAERVRSGFQTLAALYRLTDLYTPKSPDGDVLRRAAVDLLREFIPLRELAYDEFEEQKERFSRQIAWLYPDADRLPSNVKNRPVLDPEQKVPPDVRGDVQGGILRAYQGVTHGLVVMLALDSPAGAKALLNHLLNVSGVVSDSDDHDSSNAGDGVIFTNVAFTLNGLAVAGLDESALQALPEEFRQGMAARAGLLGDVRMNHPRRWTLPRRMSAPSQTTPDQGIELAAVHVAVQFRCRAVGKKQLASLEISDAGHPLAGALKALEAVGPGVQVLAIQPLRRRYRQAPGKPDVIEEHFGYPDGNAQPVVEWTSGSPDRDHVHLGEVLLGHPNAADFVPVLKSPSVQPPDQPLDLPLWLQNGSFLVMRKYRQWTERLDAAVEATALEMQKKLGGSVDGHRSTVYGKLMGRGRDGVPLADPGAGQGNNFGYLRDPQGSLCPLHAHIRRANPRSVGSAQGRPPRLMRRSMSYGPASNAGPAERGLLFMAYNASLGEQFEVVQRWLVGANSTGASSAVACPIVGVPENGIPRRFGFEHEGCVFEVLVDAPSALFEEPQAPTRLDWGLYLLAPSISALHTLLQRAACRAASGSTAVPWSVKRGREILAALPLAPLKPGDGADQQAWELARDQWKAAIEDPDAIDRLDAAALWAAIRQDKGGLLATPYGVLVADRALVAQAYLDTHQHYSVIGQLERMRLSFGEVGLGLDEGARYREESTEINKAIGMLNSDPKVFNLAHQTASEVIQRMIDAAIQQVSGIEDKQFELSFDVREILDEVLAALSQDWFGLHEDPGHRFTKGAEDWNWKPGDPPLYPGHFTALSRYMFQPHPGKVPTDLGQKYGTALASAMLNFVQDHRVLRQNGKPSSPRRLDGSSAAPLTDVLFKHKSLGHDDGFVSRTMVGVLMGFNPTIIGAVLNVLREWRRDGVFSALRSAVSGGSEQSVANRLFNEALLKAAQMRPMPQIGWRTVSKPHELTSTSGELVKLKKGDLVVMAMVSGTHQSLVDGQDDGDLMFGGRREETPAPTHACPGRYAGLQAMRGVLLALLQAPHELREGPSAFTYVIHGPTGFVRAEPAPQSAAELALSELKQKATNVAKKIAARTVGAKGKISKTGAKVLSKVKDAAEKTGQHSEKSANAGIILAWGDSWVDYEYGPLDRMDLRDALKKLGYRFQAEEFADYQAWPTIAEMANDLQRQFRKRLAEEIQTSEPPVAILLSGGGNDTTGQRLQKLINVKGNPEGVLNKLAVDRHISQLERHYKIILDDLKNSVYRGGNSKPLVIVHGYDHPLPRGETPPLYPAGRKWLHDPFVNQKHVLANREIDLDAASAAMKTLIDRLNKVLKGLAASGDYPFLRYVKLTDTIEQAFPGHAGDGWADDLHPKATMFEAMAKKIDAVIEAG